MAQEQRIQPVPIEDELKNSYLDYAMSVIVSRAIPDVRDGLKPAQRRILYSMSELALRAGSPFKKSARIVGEVMGKYHPHGDAPIYDSMVRMAQDFSMRYPLIDGQGNFGSVDNDPPAAMRYTEARLAPIAEELLADIDRDTVDFQPNFDGSLQEPVVLPGRVPNMLINGASGIAVGMATNIPPHNLGEITAALTALVDNPELTTEQLLRLVPGPDFPTGGIIQGRDGIGSAFATGRGRVVLRGRVSLEEQGRSGRYQLIISELPFQVNKAALVERIADLVREKRIDGISDLRDESDRHGMRVVIELRREAQPKQVLNSLYKFTALQSAFAVNMLALVDGQPRTLPLKQALVHYLDFRREVLRRRTQFDLNKARERAHILEGYRTALDNLDAVIRTIRQSQTAETARTNLQRQFHLSQVQAQAILDMTLRRLAAMERQRILDEYAEIIKTIAGLEDLLANPRKIDLLLKEEWDEVAKKHASPRRTNISDEEAVELTEADMVQHENVVVTLSRAGYIKRLPADVYARTTRRSRCRGAADPRDR
jgi:DNA gyrase subunit A